MLQDECNASELAAAQLETVVDPVDRQVKWQIGLLRPVASLSKQVAGPSTSVIPTVFLTVFAAVLKAIKPAVKLRGRTSPVTDGAFTPFFC